MEAFYLTYLIPLLFLVGAEAYWKYLIQKEEEQ